MKVETVYVPTTDFSFFKVSCAPDDEGNSMSCKVKKIDGVLLCKEDAEKITDLLNVIANNILPWTGRFWDKEKKRPLSYTAAYGSNGARDYMIEVAKQALQLLNP